MSAPAARRRAVLAALALTWAGPAAACAPGTRTGAPPPPSSRPATTAPTSPPPASVSVAAPDRTTATTAPLEPPPPGVPTQLGPWTLIGRSVVVAAVGDQGVATVHAADGAPTVVYRGALAVDAGLQAEGWVHVGDPDAWDGWVVDAFEAAPAAGRKMFRVTSPSGVQTEAEHPLAPGEAPNNSFAALTPDGQWTVSGEWGTEHRLLVFPTPVLNPAAPPRARLELAGLVTLARPARNVQGCAFVTATRLLCSTSDPVSDLWPTPNQVLQVDLGRALGPGPGGASVDATVTDLGEVPESSACQGVYEPEGIDVDRETGTLRIEVAPPGNCGIYTQVYIYRLRAATSR